MRMDETWKVYKDSPINKRDFLKRYTPDFYLRPEVPAVVRESFRIAHKLIEHSYYEYNFYDMAAVKAILTMEMALKLRYKELGNEDGNKIRLPRLLKWFNDRNYIEIYNPDYLEVLRKIRNIVAHPEYHTVSGPIYHRKLIGNIIDLVNGLYENPELRRERMVLTKTLNDFLESCKHGFKVTGKEFSVLSYKAWIGFFDNKSVPNRIHFYFKPCFVNIDDNIENKQLDQSLVFYCLAHVVDCQSEQLVFTDNKKNKLIVSRITDSAEQDFFNQWIDNYKEYTPPAIDNDIIMNRDPIDPFLLHLREFHKI